MIQLTDKELDEFEQLWKKHNPGKEIDREALKIAAVKLFAVVSLVYHKDLESREQ
jgi:hypothetical protein